MDDERWELESSSTHCWTCGWPRQEELWWKWTDTPPTPSVDGRDRIPAGDRRAERVVLPTTQARKSLPQARTLLRYSRGLIVKSLDVRHLFDVNVWQADGEDFSVIPANESISPSTACPPQRRVLESSDAFGAPDMAVAYSLSKKKRWEWAEQLETADFSEQLARGNVETVVGMSEDPAFSSLYTDPQLFFPSSLLRLLPSAAVQTSSLHGQDDLEWEHEPLDCWEDGEWAEDPPTERPPPMTLADHLPPDFFDLLLLSTFELVDRPRTTSSLSSDFELVQ
ncbi:hypothetical protein M3Y99_01098800 [Aphelenchoides fujianensis]|nr:hypothetical protein M3Y99_01098800 [Aphelenchoides fujianensis]